MGFLFSGEEAVTKIMAGMDCDIINRNMLRLGGSVVRTISDGPQSGMKSRYLNSSRALWCQSFTRVLLLISVSYVATILASPCRFLRNK